MKLKCEKEGNGYKNGKVSGSLSLVNGLSAERGHSLPISLEVFKYRRSIDICTALSFIHKKRLICAATINHNVQLK